jgi:TolB-like protein
VIGATVTTAIGEDKSTKPRIAVLEFRNIAQNPSPDTTTIVQDIFVTELTREKKFSVLTRKQLLPLLRKHDLPLAGEIDTATAVRIGKLLGVNYILTGTVTQYGPTDLAAPDKRALVVAFSASLVKVATGEVVWTKDSSLQGESLRDDADADLKKMTKRMVQSLTASIMSADL